MQRLIILLGLFLFVGGCSQLDKASNILSSPTAKEQYKKEKEISNYLFQLWEDQGNLAMRDSIFINAPYQETGKFRPRDFPVYSYNIALNPGEHLEVEVQKDSLDQQVFIDLFFKTSDTLKPFEKIKSAEYNSSVLKKEIEKKGIYKLVIQPEIEAGTAFQIRVKTSPVYTFPVAGASNNSIQSLWGAARDGGRRNHEGIDIFASRGTPVVAATDGRITSSGERGLGGKQVWLRDPERGQALYYAHLDSIKPLGNSRVKRGDTLGFVGNTGNARTTPPHLHFGIYRGYGGAIDPFFHVYQLDQPNFGEISSLPSQAYLLTASTSNIRNKPATKNSEVLETLPLGDTLKLLGKTKEWFHIRTAEQTAAFIHESLVKPLIREQDLE